ncbi:hypothetical protein SAMN06296036_104155 [Pseudobacteriovorax antillogorgiicola]|uniref:J domain-containing protein n=2 Tax=Pseudobacteriovorax antillogorgiicola TaxID=1513793 RepID=A0A1Y6BDZ3_9BACT|nr:hypothetical protein EDD56_104178 [Pseudobacteriovorax antillogorgiicola]SMF06706.1 hypothetical protein SAMN06296036_104155 [Pseudobacteriovorax antillogorgiicola]
MEQEEARLFLVKSLRQALCTHRGDSSDSISHLRKKVEGLRRTFELRLGILSQARHQAWFRQSHATEWGPFPGNVRKDAVFVYFSPEKARKLRNEVVRAWQEGETELESLPPGPCLWRYLLDLNHQWYSICQLASPYQDLRLNELPEGLPDDLACRSIHAFLLKVRGAVDGARTDLDHCFQVLFKASETFLNAYYQKPRSSGPGRQGAGRDRGIKSELEESLRFFEFDRTPNARDLRKRYLELAKRCHPDVAGGDDDRFKKLTHHYHQILKRLPSRA